MKLKSIFNWGILFLAVAGTLRLTASLILKSSGELQMSTAYAALNFTDVIADSADGFDPNVASLDRLRAGRDARVLAVGGEGAVARRLMEMGVIPGAPVRVVK